MIGEKLKNNIDGILFGNLQETIAVRPIALHNYNFFYAKMYFLQIALRNKND